MSGPPGSTRRGAGSTVPGKYLAYEEDGRKVVVRDLARVDPHRALAGRRRAVRRRHGVPPPRAGGRPGRGRPRARRPLAERDLRQRPARRVEPARPTATRSPSGRHTLFFLDTGRSRPPSARPARQRPSSQSAPRRAVSCPCSMAETIAVLSLKGGTGKTTTVRTLSDVLRRVGLDVLAIDLDPAGQPVGLLRRPAGRDPDDRRRPVG